MVPNNQKWDRLPNQSLFSFQLEPGIAKNPVFEGLLGRIEESIVLHYEAMVITAYEPSGFPVETLLLILKLIVPGRPLVDIRQTVRMDAIPSMTPQDAFDTAQAAIRTLLAADPFLKHRRS